MVTNNLLGITQQTRVKANSVDSYSKPDYYLDKRRSRFSSTSLTTWRIKKIKLSVVVGRYGHNTFKIDELGLCHSAVMVRTAIDQYMVHLLPNTLARKLIGLGLNDDRDLLYDKFMSEIVRIDEGNNVNQLDKIVIKEFKAILDAQMDPATDKNETNQKILKAANGYGCWLSTFELSNGEKKCFKNSLKKIISEIEEKQKLKLLEVRGQCDKIQDQIDVIDLCDGDLAILGNIGDMVDSLMDDNLLIKKVYNKFKNDQKMLTFQLYNIIKRKCSDKLSKVEKDFIDNESFKQIYGKPLELNKIKGGEKKIIHDLDEAKNLENSYCEDKIKESIAKKANECCIAFLKSIANGKVKNSKLPISIQLSVGSHVIYLRLNGSSMLIDDLNCSVEQSIVDINNGVHSLEIFMNKEASETSYDYSEESRDAYSTKIDVRAIVYNSDQVNSELGADRVIKYFTNAPRSEYELYKRNVPALEKISIVSASTQKLVFNDEVDPLLWE